MAGTPASATAKALASVDLLRLIFAELPREDAAHAALVCRNWLNLARDVIWETVADPIHFFSLLAPIKTRIATQEQHFARPPTARDFRRLEPFAQRVRAIYITWASGVAQTLLPVIASLTPSTHYLLPKLRNLVWRDDNHPAQHTNFIYLFLVPSLRSLSIKFTSTEGSLFHDISGRCPSLQELTVRVGLGVQFQIIESGLCHLLRTLPLRVVDLPLYFLTPPLLSAAFQCPTLVDVRAEESVHKVFMSRLNWRPCSGYTRTVDTEASLAALETLELAIPLMELNFLLGRELFPRLRSLSIRVIGNTRRETVAEFCFIVSKWHLRLETIKLNMHRPSRQPNPWESPAPSDAITIDDLFPLVALHDLTTLRIAHDHLIKVTDPELIAFASALPQLQELMLNETPLSCDEQPTLTIDCLTSLAPLLPELTTLGLYFDATHDRTYRPAPTSFKSLTLAVFNQSPVRVNKCRDIALYLSTVLTDGAILSTAFMNIWFDVIPKLCHAHEDWEGIEQYFTVIMDSRRWLREALVS